MACDENCAGSRGEDGPVDCLLIDQPERLSNWYQGGMRDRICVLTVLLLKDGV